MTQTRIAFVDVDMTLVDNQTSEYNENLVRHLANYDAVYLITGRSVSDTWQHVLQRGNPSAQWKKQLLTNVQQYLIDQGVKVKSVSTPYDHYLSQTQAENTPLKVQYSGEACAKFYFAFERAIASKSNITEAGLVTAFQAKAPGASYPTGFGENDTLANAMPSYLAIQGDTEKKGQVAFLCEKVAADGFALNNIHIDFFDDKPENLQSVKNTLESKNIACSTYEVHAIKDYRIPATLSNYQPRVTQHAYNIKMRVLSGFIAALGLAAVAVAITTLATVGIGIISLAMAAGSGLSLITAFGVFAKSGYISPEGSNTTTPQNA